MNFERAAATYDDYAIVQNKSADRLLQLIGAYYRNTPRKILEVGCGTGYLTQKMLSRYPYATYYANDASRTMLEKCRQKVGLKPIHYIKGRAEALDLRADLLVSNFGMHWLSSFGRALKKFWYHTSDAMFFAVPIEGTFANWYETLEALGIDTRRFPFMAEKRLRWLMHYLDPSAQEMIVEDISQSYTSIKEFMLAMNHMGLNTHPVDNVVDVRPLFAYLEEEITINYRVAFCVLKKFG